MKKNVIRWNGMLEFPLVKLVRTMKLTVLIICLSVFSVLASNTFGQRNQLTLKMKNTSIKDVLLEIENQSDFYLLYNNELVDVERRVNIDVSDKSVPEILESLFEDQPIEFSIVGRQIIIKPSVEANAVHSTQSQISGTVKDDTGAPLPGVTVMIKGTTIGTVTDFDGR